MLTLQLSNDGSYVVAKAGDQELRIPVPENLRNRANSGHLNLEVVGDPINGALLTLRSNDPFDPSGKYVDEPYKQCLLVVSSKAKLTLNQTYPASVVVGAGGGGRGHIVTVSIPPAS
jgi:hypothetical protein